MPFIERVVSVEPRLDTNNPMDIVTIGSGEKNIANREQPDVPRDKVGDFVLALRPGLLLPESILRLNGLWDEEKGKGISIMKGSKNNRTSIVKMAGMPSEVMLVRIERLDDVAENGQQIFEVDLNGKKVTFTEDTVLDVLGIEKWINPNA
jgi:hypothetical protein